MMRRSFYCISVITILFFVTLMLLNRSGQEQAPTLKILQTKKKQTLPASCTDLRERAFRLPEVTSGSSVAELGKFGLDLRTSRPDFRFEIRPTSVIRRLVSPSSSCVTGKGIVVVHFVKTSISNRERREAIRETWASARLIGPGGSRQEVVFIVGRTTDDEARQQLIDEATRNGDILQIDRDDTSNNVALKTVAGMQFAASFLEPHWLYTSCDDDVVVNPWNLINHLSVLADTGSPLIATSKAEERPCYEQLPLMCVYSFQRADLPARNPASKWYVSRDRYPLDKWPPYCRGGMYAMPVGMAARLYAVSRSTSFLHLEDVWVTGLVRRKLGNGDVNIHAMPFSKRNDTQLSATGDTLALREGILRHLWGNIDGLTVDVPTRMREEWTSIGRKGNGCET